MKKFVALFLFFYTSLVVANESIVSLRTIYHAYNKGIMFISSGRTDNHSKNHKQLQSLWRSKKITFKDKDWGEWKTTEIDEISFNKGADAQNFLIFHNKQAVSVNVKGAYLYQSGCAGEIVPVLDIGEWPFKGEPYFYEGIAIEVDNKYGIPQITKVSKSFLSYLSDDEKKLVKTEYFQPIELKWEKLTDKQIILVKYDPGNGEYAFELIVIDKNTKKLKILKSKTVLDGRC